MKLLKLVLTAHLNGGGGKDWRFCLLMASILSEIAMKNARKGNNNNNNSDNNNNNSNNNNNNNNNDKNLAADIPRGCSSCPLFPGWIGIWNISFEEGEKPSEQGKEPKTIWIHMWRQVQELNPGHSGGRWVFSPLRHPRSSKEYRNSGIISKR